MKSINFDEIGRKNFGEKAAIEILAKTFNASKRIIAMTGAGISVNAGIPVTIIIFGVKFFNFLGFSFCRWIV